MITTGELPHFENGFPASFEAVGLVEREPTERRGDHVA